MIDVEEAFAPLAKTEAAFPSKVSAGATWTPLVPVSSEAPKLTMTLITRCAPPGYVYANGWRYLDACRRLLGCVVRYNRCGPGEGKDKEFRPFTFCENGKGRREWRCQTWPEPRPLYGLDKLAARPEAPVLVVEGEKTTDAAAERFPEHVTVTSPGGSHGARSADWFPLAGRHIVIWPDADQPGSDYADEVVEMLGAIGVASVRLVDLPEVFRDGWDLADPLPDGASDDDPARLLFEAGPISGNDPLPLFPPIPKSERYPIEALGPILGRAAAAIARKVQVPEAIAAQSVLAAAALAAQAHADVMLPFGQSRPLSLYLVTVAGSGDRKTTADNEALWPIRKREKNLKEEYDRDFKTWSIAQAAWSAEKRKVEGKAGLGVEGRKAALRDLGPEPDRPLYPFLTAPDLTVEGLAKAWVAAPAGLGIFTAEGGQFVGGHGMSPDHRLKSAAVYSQIWDGQPVKRIRAGDGVTILPGRRASMHLMVQPDAAQLFLSDSILRDQGLLSRVLVAAPESVAGTRFYRSPTAEDDVAIKAYGARLLAVLELPWPLLPGGANELEPRVLNMSKEAAAAWRIFYDHIESQCGTGSNLVSIQDFAAKAAEHAARIAGVLTIIEQLEAIEIPLQSMAAALALTDWYVNEALRLQGAARTDPRLLRAQALLDWMQRRQDRVISAREILQFGPSATRTKSSAEESLGVLLAHGWIAEVKGRPRRFRLIETGRRS